MPIRRDILHHEGLVRSGADLLHDPRRNKGTAFSPTERAELGLRGLLPARVLTEDQQVQLSLENVRRAEDPLQRYIAMAGLQDRNETLYFRVLQDNLEELMPIVYTPTVGKACEEYAHIFKRPRGLFLSASDRGRIGEALNNWTERDVRVIVVTDGERILGLGDLGANGMGISIGKLNLYTACAGVDPRVCLPITLDVGTNNSKLKDDPYYIGLRSSRLYGDEYDSFVEEFVTEIERAYPGVLLQFEDFGNNNAFRMLERYRDRMCCFNDDIQGTAAVGVAGVLSALRISGGDLADQRILFLGAGGAGVGIADLLVAELVHGGMAPEQARLSCWFVDSRGLVVQSRTDLESHKRRYAHRHAPVADLAAAVEALQPTVLIGVSGQPQAFTRPVIEAMAAHHERPVIFALSNPTSKAECTAEQAYEWSVGRAIFASGSPFDPVDIAGQTFVPGQGNNAYIFPGVGLGLVASRARRVPDEVFRIAARTLAEATSLADLERGSLYPPLVDIRSVSLRIATAVAEYIYGNGLSSAATPDDVVAHVAANVYEPNYPAYLTD